MLTALWQTKRPVSFPFEDNTMGVMILTRKSHDATQNKRPNVVHFNVPCKLVCKKLAASKTLLWGRQKNSWVSWSAGKGSTVSVVCQDIRGDPGSVSGAGEKSKRTRKKFGRKKVKNFAFLTFFRPNFFLVRLDFFPPQLIVPGSPRMLSGWNSNNNPVNHLWGVEIKNFTVCHAGSMATSSQRHQTWSTKQWYSTVEYDSKFAVDMRNVKFCRVSFICIFCTLGFSQ